MDRVQLLRPAPWMEGEIDKYRTECADCGEISIHGSGGLHRLGDYAQWLDWSYRNESAQTVAAGFVPSTQYVAVREGDLRVVGLLQLRHMLNDALLHSGGHIGYSVRPNDRRRGYATQMLALALSECRQRGIARVLITCDEDNKGSARTIEKNGGVIEDVRQDENGGPFRRYWIALDEGGS